MKHALGIVGAGKLGIALAHLAVDAGFEVMLNSRNLENTRLIADVMVPGSRVGTLDQVSAHSNIVVLAVPLYRLGELPGDAFAGKVLIDAVNYWEPVDGPIERFGVAKAATSSLVQAHFPGARVVKSLNQLGYHDLEEGRRPRGAADRLGVAVAGDDAGAVAAVKEVVDGLGFDPVDAGSLSQGAHLGPGGPAFGAPMTAGELQRALRISPS